MKTIKIALPALAFVFAVLAAFATNSKKEDTSMIQYLKRTGGSPACQACHEPDYIAECAMDVSSIVCLCQSGEQLHVGSAAACMPMWRF